VGVDTVENAAGSTEDGRKSAREVERCSITNIQTLSIRTPSQEQYGRALAQAYRLFRIPDPSFAVANELSIDAKLLLDAGINHAFTFRWLLIAGTKYGVQPPPNATPQDALLAGIQNEMVGRVKKLPEAVRNLARGDLSGARFGSPRWRMEPMTIDGKTMLWAIPSTIADMDKSQFRLVTDSQWGNGSGDTRKVRVSSQAFDIHKDDWVNIVEPWRYLKHVVNDTQEYFGYGRGLRDALFYNWYAKSQLLVSMTEAADRFGVGYVDVGIDGLRDADSGMPNPQVVSDWLAVLKDMRATGAFVRDKNDELNMLESSGTGWKLMTELWELLSGDADRLILGARLPTGGGDSGVGSLARAEVEKDSTTSIIKACRKSLEETFSCDLLGAFNRLNVRNLAAYGLTDARSGTFTIGDDEDDIAEGKSSDERATAALDAGLTLKRSEAYDAFGFTPPEPGDEIIETAPEPPPMMPPGMAPGQPGQPGMTPDQFADSWGDRFDELFERKHPRAKDGRFDKKSVARKSVAKTALQMTMASGGATISTGSKVPSTGFVYSPFRDKEWHKPIARVNVNDISSYMEEHADALAKEDHFLGTWYDSDTGEVFIDVVVVEPDRTKALDDALKAEQIAVWDIENSEVVETGHGRQDRQEESGDSKSEGADAGADPRGDQEAEDVNFDEEFERKHPRDSDGEFAPKGGGAATATIPDEITDTIKRVDEELAGDSKYPARDHRDMLIRYTFKHDPDMENEAEDILNQMSGWEETPEGIDKAAKALGTKGIKLANEGEAVMNAAKAAVLGIVKAKSMGFEIPNVMLHVDGSLAEKDHAKNSIAYYSPRRKIINLVPHSMKALGNGKVGKDLESSDPNDVVLHEMMHALHHKQAPEQFMKIAGDIQNDSRINVLGKKQWFGFTREERDALKGQPMSPYAKFSPLELVAETVVRLSTGGFVGGDTLAFMDAVGFKLPKGITGKVKE